MIELHVGEIVRRVHPEGSENAGQPYGGWLTVKQIYPHEPHALCVLSDGRSEFEFNLQKVELAI